MVKASFNHVKCMRFLFKCLFLHPLLICLVSILGCKDNDPPSLCSDDIRPMPENEPIIESCLKFDVLSFRRTMNGQVDSVDYIRTAVKHDFLKFDFCDTAHIRYARTSIPYIAEDGSHKFVLEVVHDVISQLFMFTNDHALMDRHQLNAFADSISLETGMFYDCHSLEDILIYKITGDYSKGLYNSIGRYNTTEKLGNAIAHFNFDYGIVHLQDNIGTSSMLKLERLK